MPRRCPARFVAARPGRGRAAAGELHASQEVVCRKLPEARRAPWPALGRDRAALPGTLGVPRDVREHVHVRDRDDLGDELCGYRCETALSALLPGRGRTTSRRSSYTIAERARGKREPAPRALGAALHGPRAGRAAALADRRAQSDERVAAGLAECGAWPPTDRAALRKEQLEHAVIVGALLVTTLRKDAIGFLERLRGADVVPLSGQPPGVDGRARVEPLDQASRLVGVVVLRQILPDQGKGARG